MKTIAIIGAGLLGRLLALSLNRQGYQITLLDKDSKNGYKSAAYAAAGLLTPLGEAMHCTSDIVEMGFESLLRWPSILSTLDGYTFFQQNGAIIVSHQQDISEYQRFFRYITCHYPQHSINLLDRQQLGQLEPELGRSFNQGLFLPQEGQIGNRKLLIALQAQLEKEQVTWFSNCHVNNINENGIIGYSSKNNNNQHFFDLLIDCRGTGARVAANKNNAKPLTDLRAVRGELFQLLAPNVNFNRPIRLMHPRYQLYIAPKGKGHYVVGATEIESDDKSSMTVRSAMELLSAAYSVHPGFAEANIRQHISQCRPAFSDNNPKITTNGQLIQVNGLYRHGFLIAPVMVQRVEEAVRKIFKGAKR